MSSIKLRAAVIVGALIAMTLPGLANAAMVVPARGMVAGTHADVSQVHWEYRHHHRYWVPDHRDDHRR